MCLVVYVCDVSSMYVFDVSICVSVMYLCDMSQSMYVYDVSNGDRVCMCLMQLIVCVCV